MWRIGGVYLVLWLLNGTNLARHVPEYGRLGPTTNYDIPRHPSHVNRGRSSWSVLL